MQQYNLDIDHDPGFALMKADTATKVPARMSPPTIKPIIRSGFILGNNSILYVNSQIGCKDEKSRSLQRLCLNLLRDFGRATVMEAPLVLVAFVGSEKRIHYRSNGRKDEECGYVVHGKRSLSL